MAVTLGGYHTGQPLRDTAITHAGRGLLHPLSSGFVSASSTAQNEKLLRLAGHSWISHYAYGTRRLGTKERAISILSYSAIKGKMLHPNHNLPNSLLLNYYVQEITPFRKATGKSKAHSRGTSPSSTFPPLAGGCSPTPLPALIENSPSPHPAMLLCIPSGTQPQLCSSESSRQLDNRKPTWTALKLAL